MLKKELIIYHSATGNTEKVAKIIASELKCDLLKTNNNDNSNPGKLSAAITIVKQIIQHKQFKTELEKIDMSSYNRIYIENFY